MANLKLNSNQRERRLFKNVTWTATGNYILAWKWKLTACACINVNYKILPLVRKIDRDISQPRIALGSLNFNLQISHYIAAYLMFVFQLKISEETAGLKLTNGTRA